MKPGLQATVVSLVVNSVLCVLKLGVGFSASSLSLLSDGVNSLTDVVSSVAILLAVRVSGEEADEGHPFGHHRAEPIAALVVAIFAGIAGFEILKEAVIRLFVATPSALQGPLPFLVLAASVASKSALVRFLHRIGNTINSPAIRAAAADSVNDILVSVTALVAVTGVYFGWGWLDAAGGVVISIVIFRAGYKIGRDNIDYLMGRSPDPKTLRSLRKTIAGIDGVGRIDRLRAHYVGTYVHVEIEVSPSTAMSSYKTHDLEEAIRSEVESIESVDRAFVHLNPKVEG